MKRILIPTDFSENAGDALAYALDFIGNAKAKIHIINVVTPTVVAPDMPAVTVDLASIEAESAREDMRAIEETSKLYFGEGADSQVQVSTSVVIGVVSQMIKEEARSFMADLIIMGTRGGGRSIVQQWLGTISNEVINKAPCPVILIPKGYKFKKIENVIFTTNLNHGDPYELWRASELIKPHIDVIRCLHIQKDKDEKDKEGLEEFAKYMVNHSPTIETIFHVEESSNIEAAVSEFAENFDSELIIMNRSKKTFLEDIFSPRHTRKMSAINKIPLMVMDHQ